MVPPKRRSLITVSPEHLPGGWLASAQAAVTGAAERLEADLKAQRPVGVRLQSVHTLRDSELETLKGLASELRANSDVLLYVAGGGTGLGPRAVLEALRSPLEDSFPIVFLGNQLDPAFLGDVLERLGERRLALLIAGQGLLSAETLAAVAALRECVQTRHGQQEAQRRIVVAADGDCVDLIQLAGREGYRLRPMPPNLSGRFSLWTEAGLLPLAVAGLDVVQVIEGARSQSRAMESKVMEDNPGLLYAAARLGAQQAEATVELLWTEGPRWASLGEYWRYLMSAAGGLLPVGVTLQSGGYAVAGWQRQHRARTLNTLLSLEASRTEATIPAVEEWPSADALAGQKVAELMPRLARQSVQKQAPDGFLEVSLPRLDAFHLGALLGFFQRSAAYLELAGEGGALDERELRLAPDLARGAAK